VLLVLIATGSAVVIKFYLDPFTFVDGPASLNLQGCLTFNVVRLVWIVYLLLFVHESAILSLTFVGILRYQRYNTSSLFRTILRDGISFYAIITAMSIVIIVLLNGRDFKSYITAFGLAALHRNLNSVLCVRLMFNIRRAAADQGGLKRHKRSAAERGILVEREVVIVQEAEIEMDSDQRVDQPGYGEGGIELH